MDIGKNRYSAALPSQPLLAPPLFPTKQPLSAQLDLLEPNVDSSSRSCVLKNSVVDVSAREKLHNIIKHFKKKLSRKLRQGKPVGSYPISHIEYLEENLTKLLKKINVKEIADVLNKYNFIADVVGFKKMSCVIGATFILALDDLDIQEIKDLLQKTTNCYGNGFRIRIEVIAASQRFSPNLRIRFLDSLKNFLQRNKFLSTENKASDCLSLEYLNVLNSISFNNRENEVFWMSNFIKLPEEQQLKCNPNSVDKLFGALVFFKDYSKCPDFKHYCSHMKSYKRLEYFLLHFYHCCYEQPGHKLEFLFFNELFGWRQRAESYKSIGKIVDNFERIFNRNVLSGHSIEVQAKVFLWFINNPKKDISNPQQVLQSVVEGFDKNYQSPLAMIGPTNSTLKPTPFNQTLNTNQSKLLLANIIAKPDSIDFKNFSQPECSKRKYESIEQVTPSTEDTGNFSFSTTMTQSPFIHLNVLAQNPNSDDFNNISQVPQVAHTANELSEIINYLNHQLLNIKNTDFFPLSYANYLKEDLIDLLKNITTAEMTLALSQYDSKGFIQGIKKESFAVGANFILALNGLNAAEIKELLKTTTHCFHNNITELQAIAASQPLQPHLRLCFILHLKKFFEKINSLSRLPNNLGYISNYLINSIHIPPGNREKEIIWMNNFIDSTKDQQLEYSCNSPDLIDALFSAFVLFGNYPNCLNLNKNDLNSAFTDLGNLELLLTNLYRCCYDRPGNKVEFFLFERLFNWKQQVTSYASTQKIIQSVSKINHWSNYVETTTQAKILLLTIIHPANEEILKSNKLNAIVAYFDEKFILTSANHENVCFTLKPRPLVNNNQVDLALTAQDTISASALLVTSEELSESSGNPHKHQKNEQVAVTSKRKDLILGEEEFPCLEGDDFFLPTEKLSF